MKQDCLDIGIVQAFMDGELDHAATARVSGHIANCDACALMLADAEDETAIVFPALEREFNTLVPTQRLWTKINDSIATERQNRPIWEKALAFFSFRSFTPQLAAAASVVLIVGVVTLTLVMRGTAPVNTAYTPTKNASTPSVAGVVPPAVPSDPATSEIKNTQSDQPVRVERADYRPTTRRAESVPVTSMRPAASPDTTNGYLPGEESYVKTIASLSQSVDGQKDTVMRGSERISFERDLAVVDDAISKMKVEVKKNPKNESAKQVLYSSYQNKIDLLNSVSQKEELVASLR